MWAKVKQKERVDKEDSRHRKQGLEIGVSGNGQNVAEWRCRKSYRTRTNSVFKRVRTFIKEKVKLRRAYARDIEHDKNRSIELEDDIELIEGGDMSDV